MNFPDFKNPGYLKEGTPRQKEAYKTLSSLKIFELLNSYSPILTGTIPIDIDLPESDLDIICSSSDLTEFAAQVKVHFGDCQRFKQSLSEINNEESVVTNFFAEGFDLEIFCQNKSTDKQNAYLHMLAEAKVIAIGGEAFKKQARLLKTKGIKTEPAFAQLLSLPGDPYQAVLDLNHLSEEKLRELVVHKVLLF
ncbi:DUF4269 domain-containing protein [Bacteriovorax stolpii]|uniref:DUF4269 domain-containing protein n=1 Tax=Bacteriovorax stolpii TaxID=960 RepID=UPI0011592D53|nr:DUF4269 domain-containing protein [Bacteriovorax stolpii]QDK40473.1 DUF4269 domain-containing protein [Bacteriovorax stolpii]